MKVVNLDFGKKDKTPQIIEEKLNEVLSKGQFKSAVQSESPTTGRLFYSVFIKPDGPQDTFVKVFRENQAHTLTEKVNEFLINADVRAINQSSCYKSNQLIMTLFCKKNGTPTSQVKTTKQQELSE